MVLRVVTISLSLKSNYPLFMNENSIQCHMNLVTGKDIILALSFIKEYIS